MSLIQLRRDTAANWTSADPVLSSGEIGVEVDTNKFKIGDGSTAWSSLAYQGGFTPPSPSTHNFITHDGTDWVMTSMTPVTGDIPYFDGTSWITSALPSALPSGTSPQLLYHDGSSWTATSLTPGSNDVLYWTGSAWGTTPMGGLPSGTNNGDVLTWNGTAWQSQAPTGIGPGSSTNNVAYWNGTAWSDITVTSLLPTISSGQVLGYDSFSGWMGYSLPTGLPSATTSGETAVWSGSSWNAQKLNANDVDWSSVPTAPGSPGTLWNNSGVLQIA